MDNRTIGILGGGQLGRMLCAAASRRNIAVAILDKDGAPAKQINPSPYSVNGSFSDPRAIRKLARQCDILTVEIEHVDTHVLEELEKEHNVEIQPHWETIRVIQDKYAQKERLMQGQVDIAESVAVEKADEAELDKVATKLGLPFMLKARRDAYDGRGNYPVKTKADFKPALEALAGRPLYAEKWAKFTKELAVMVLKTKNDADPNDWESSTLSYPTVETVHEDSICKLVYAPATGRGISKEQDAQAQVLARRAIASFKGKGIFGVEMFLLDNGRLLVNEIAPRPHNSGHYTIEACRLSQYDAHLLAILDRPIPPKGLQLRNVAIMLNILGGSDPKSYLKLADAADAIGAKVHLYGKGDARRGRKMGHVTVTADSMAEAEKDMLPLVKIADDLRLERMRPQEPTQPQQKISSGSPLVAVVMGSDSDLKVMWPGMEILEQFSIPYVCDIPSAHRSATYMTAFAKSAVSKGYKVIIAGAGGAAHLPGMIAANTPLPVIGVPVKGSSLDGMDSLLSIVQMPKGVPVATVAINNSTNAALLAVKILAASDAVLLDKMKDYMEDLDGGVEKKRQLMKELGPRAYLEKMQAK